MSPCGTACDVCTGAAIRQAVSGSETRSRRDALTGEDYFQDVALQPNDVVWIPRSRISNVNLIVEQYIRNNLSIQYIPFAF